MNTGAFGERFPYTNFHDLNLDWIIKTFKDFLNQVDEAEATITTATDENIERANTEITQIINDLIATIPPDYTQLTAEALQSSGVFVDNSNIDDYKELNNIPVQRVYLYGREAYTSGELLHYPELFTSGALVVSFNYQTPRQEGCSQLAFSMNGSGIATRVNNGVTWTNWQYNEDIYSLKSSNVFVDSNNLDTYKELNNLSMQTIIIYGREAYTSGELLHYPTQFTNGALIITTNYQITNSNGAVQIAISMTDGSIASRANNGTTWSEWNYGKDIQAVHPSGIIYDSNNVTGHTDIADTPQCQIITYGKSAVEVGLQHAPNRFKWGFTMVKMPYLFGNTTGEMFIAIDLASGAIATKTITTGTDTPYVYSNPYYTVGATGCDFTTIRSCLEYIAHFHIQNSTVMVTEGTYDLVSEYADVLENTVVNGTGLPIGDGTHIICGEKTAITFNYEGTRDDIGENFSLFNVYGSCTFEHVHANCKNCKYIVHDDVPVMIQKGVITELPKDLIVKYIDCSFVHSGNPNVSYSTPICIGGGTIPAGMYIIDGGSFSCPNTFPYPISYHNHIKSQLGTYGARIVIRNIWLPTERAIRFGTYGDSQIVGSIDGCKLGANTSYGSPTTYFPIEEWNNVVS